MSWYDPIGRGGSFKYCLLLVRVQLPAQKGKVMRNALGEEYKVGDIINAYNRTVKELIRVGGDKIRQEAFVLSHNKTACLTMSLSRKKIWGTLKADCRPAQLDCGLYSLPIYPEKIIELRKIFVDGKDYLQIHMSLAYSDILEEYIVV